jgi:hypothetical protein
MRPDQLERRLRQRLDTLGPAPRAELLRVLMLPDFNRHNLLADRPRKKPRETRGDAAHEEQRQQAMSAILLIPVAVGFILFVVCLVMYLLYGRGDEDDDDRGILGVLSDLLSWW